MTKAVIGVPDTLTLEDRAWLAYNAVVGLADEDFGHIPFFSANLIATPAFMQHGDWDYGSSHGRLIDAGILARHMNGTREVSDTERAYRRNFMGFFGPDGLSYRQINPHGHWQANAHLIDQRAVLLAMTTWMREGADDSVRAALERHVAALKRIAVKERDVWYYPASEYTPSGWPSANAVQMRLAADPASFCGRLIMPLLKYHTLTGSQDALELCHFFANLIVHRSGVFLPDGSFNDALPYRSGHFHTRLGTLDGLARLAALTHDHALTAFVKRSFDWALTQGTQFGWTPGDLYDQRYEHETCSLVDLISIGIVLAGLGYAQYWGVVERFVRNHLTESQLLDLSWVQEGKGEELPGWLTYRGIGGRLQGAFAGYSAPNDYACNLAYGRGHINDVQACCIGSGVRGLFLAWSHSIARQDDGVYVNMLLNRGSQWLDVHSHLPYQGLVELHIHQDLPRLFVRVPQWAGYARVSIERWRDHGQSTLVHGSDPSTWMHAHYVRIGNVTAGETVRLRFPVAEETTREVASGQSFEVRWRGDEVVQIDPPGEHHPFYNHRQYGHQPALLRRSLSRPQDVWMW